MQGGEGTCNKLNQHPIQRVEKLPFSPCHSMLKKLEFSLALMNHLVRLLQIRARKPATLINSLTVLAKNLAIKSFIINLPVN